MWSVTVQCGLALYCRSVLKCNCIQMFWSWECYTVKTSDHQHESVWKIWTSDLNYCISSWNRICFLSIFRWKYFLKLSLNHKENIKKGLIRMTPMTASSWSLKIWLKNCFLHKDMVNFLMFSKQVALLIIELNLVSKVVCAVVLVLTNSSWN